MIVRENIYEDFTHLRPKTEGEIEDALMNTTDHRTLLKAIEMGDKNQQAYIKRFIEFNADSFKDWMMGKFKLDDGAKEELKKHISSKDSIATLVKAFDIFKDKKYMDMAMQQLLREKPGASTYINTNSGKLTKDLSKTCFDYWKNLGIEFNKVTDVKFLNDKKKFPRTNSRLDNADSFVAKDTILNSDGNGSIYCHLIGYIIKKGRISVVENNLASVLYGQG